MLYIDARNLPADQDLYNYLVKQMINIECNKCLFDINGGPGHGGLFNVYKTANTSQSIYAKAGRIILYFGNSTRTHGTRYYINRIEDAMDALVRDLNRGAHGIPAMTKVDIYSLDTREHTGHVVKRELFQRGFTTYGGARINWGATAGNKFLWYVTVYMQSSCIPANAKDIITGLIKKPTAPRIEISYTLLSLSTIIVDSVGLLNYPNGHMQMDYPALADYTISTTDRYLGDIRISKAVLREVHYIFKNSDRPVMHKHTYSIKWDEQWPDVTHRRRGNPLKPLQFIRRDIGITIEQQMLKLCSEVLHSDPAAEECLCLSEGRSTYATGPDSLMEACFETDVPLYGSINVVVIECSFKYKIDEAEHTKIFSCIILCKNEHTFPRTFACAANEDNIINIRMQISIVIHTIYPRTMRSVLEHCNIPQAKKDLLYAIEKYSAYQSTADDTVYVVDAEKKKIYVGVSNLTPATFMRYHDCETILFRIL